MGFYRYRTLKIESEITFWYGERWNEPFEVRDSRHSAFIVENFANYAGRV
jgi:hypothetical protein